MLGPASNNLLLDPSMLVARKTLKDALRLSTDVSRRKFSLYVPASFQRAILADKLSQASPVFNFFLHNARPSQISELSSIVGTYIGFETTPNHRALYEAFYGSLGAQRLLHRWNLDQTITEVIL